MTDVEGRFDDLDASIDNEGHSKILGGTRASFSDLVAPRDCRTLPELADVAQEGLRDAEGVIRRLEPGLARELLELRESAHRSESGLPEWVSVPGAFDDADGELVDEEDGGSLEVGEAASTDSDFEGSERFDGDDDEGDEEPCQGLCDLRIDQNPKACLTRAKEEYDVDLLDMLRRHGIQDFLERVRVVNFARSLWIPCEGKHDEVEKARQALEREMVSWSRSQVRTGDEWLLPKLREDPLLTILEEAEME
mmetsp:Transcript_748/g.1563  ORF Transcript_748/g.1563 Transcript_748/m.1563 type:complete len:251 (-) Transcript_748:758-1510(-)|eukprot:CAMPEP_0184683816 /NCGR_PEP_ID=MMETSP0312-20130426/12686_1 /TAXON_ID=31354 /ORGANISM="Compsopogon coeruleus, Strain SAG 36.94" /LENGTH=250 /DNA_ID=CAMNT_0027136449 /DNA_START=125 /DNA_END=877 /DNA_ORIENTATION=-